MGAGDLALVVAQLVAFGLVGWASGRLLLRWARLDDVGPPERCVASVVGFLCFAVAAMLLNVVTRGWVFGTPGVVPVLALGPLAAWAATRPAWKRPAVPWTVVVLGLALVALYLVPVLLGGPGVRTGDSPWHLGWTEQLLGGEPVPVGPAPELARNAYPWGYHAFLATLVHLAPASTPLLAHEATHVILLASIPLVAACLARRVDRRAGLAAAACTSLVGGFGWLAAREPAFVASPRAGRFGADLVVASPNSVYELFPPALPRELGLVIAGAAALFILLAAERKTRPTRVAAGAVAGLVGVVSVPMLFTALVWALVGTLIVNGRRLRPILEILLPAVAVFALWAGPVAFGYLQHGGFVDITPRLGMEWPLPTALAAYGLLLPLAIAGAVVARRSPLVVLMGASAALLGLAVARDVFDWTVWNNATLLHQGRMWPPVHLLAGALGGIALVRGFDYVSRRSRRAAIMVVGAGAAVAVASPVLASLQVRTILEEHRDGFVYGRPDYEEGSFVTRAARELGPGDVVGGGSDEILWALFQTSGARLSHYDDPRLPGNDLRIRYADLAREWDERTASGGFEPTHLVVPAAGREEVPGAVVARGEFEGDVWLLLHLE